MELPPFPWLLCSACAPDTPPRTGTSTRQVANLLERQSQDPISHLMLGQHPAWLHILSRLYISLHSKKFTRSNLPNLISSCFCTLDSNQFDEITLSPKKTGAVTSECSPDISFHDKPLERAPRDQERASIQMTSKPAPFFLVCMCVCV